ncbi:MAG: rod shape-determining protein, partial [Selenomonadaceae bacterium]|nr:rod shape-determining protein [Selenomonadaceae bacterium]
RHKLEEKVGELNSAAVAAAGRALYTMTAEAELEMHGIITLEHQNNLDFTGVQAAQSQLANSQIIPEETSYYCVGFSVISYELDGIRLKSLVGQRGRLAKVKVIATFLPRQVIDSMQSALRYSELEMRALTLEPIAAINVLIPPTMRHLNLVLVDIGAGTSDVAITKNGAVIAYGMVPIAGDEITETLSQKFLLDFNIAETVKRKAAGGEDATFTDILGMTQTLTAQEVFDAIDDTVKHLAESIAKTILELNINETPQAIMLVGGGSLTPNLPKHVAAAMNMPEMRVGIRKPNVVDGIINIPTELFMPDAVTPLGILKIATINTLHFLTVYINNEEFALFHFQQLTVGDALLNVGVQLRKLNGKPGLGLVVFIEGEKKFYPGSMGEVAKLTVDGEEASLEMPLKNNCHIQVESGADGVTPVLKVEDVLPDLPSFKIKINGVEEEIKAKVLVNGEVSLMTRVLQDNDDIRISMPTTIGEVLRLSGYAPTGQKIRYRLNGKTLSYVCTPKILMNEIEAKLSLPVHDGDVIEYLPNDTPKVADVLNISGLSSSVRIIYSGDEYFVPTISDVDLMINGRPGNLNTLINDGARIEYKKFEKRDITVSDALLAVDFKPPNPKSRIGFEIKVNGKDVDFADPMHEGDTLEVILKSPDGTVISSESAIEIPMAGEGEPMTPDSIREISSKRKLTIRDFIRND